MPNTKYLFCDIFLLTPAIVTRRLTDLIKEEDGKIALQMGALISGFVGLNIKRNAGASLVSNLRQIKINGFNVPTEYRDSKLISVDQAIKIAREHCGKPDATFAMVHRGENPLWWSLFSSDLPTHGEGGGRLAIDKLDGKVWGMVEMERYMAEFNNLS